MSLYKRNNCWHYRFRWNGRQYRGTCKTSKKAQAQTVESLVRVKLVENNCLPGSRKRRTLAEFSVQFFDWLDALPADRPPKKSTRRYYHVGWKLLEKTTIAKTAPGSD